jgi:hypothetical protein
MVRNGKPGGSASVRCLLKRVSSITRAVAVFVNADFTGEENAGVIETFVPSTWSS